MQGGPAPPHPHSPLHLPHHPAPAAPTSLDVADEVSGDVLVVDAAGGLMQHNVPGSRGLPVGKGVGGRWC